MRSSYKPIGDFIRLVDERNTGLKIPTLLGLTISKEFIPSVANIVGSDMENYKIIRKNQFACSLMQVRRDKKIPVALLTEMDEAIISQAYPVFEIENTEKLLPEYLMMWFSRTEFDREASFYAVGGVRGSLEWEDFCNMQLPVPSIEKQKEIVKEYNPIVNRIKINEQLNLKLEETAQAIYKQWFVDFEFPDENGNPYKSSSGEMEYNAELDKEIPKGWGILSLSSISEMKYGKMLSEEEFTEEGFPVFSGYGIRGFYKDFMYEKPQLLVIARGVSGTGEVKMSPPKSYITNLSIIIEVNELKANKYYLFHYLNTHNLRSLDSGSAQSQITINDLSNVKIVNPSLQLQLKFGEMIHTIGTNTELLNKDNKILDNFKNILLSKLATIETKND